MNIICDSCKRNFPEEYISKLVKYGNICNDCLSIVKEKKSKKDNDPVNHPSHYTSDPSGVECITITRHRNFNIGNAIKYLWRAGLKDSPQFTSGDKEKKHIEDLKKAVWYINDEIARLNKQNPNFE